MSKSCCFQTAAAMEPGTHSVARRTTGTEHVGTWHCSIRPAVNNAISITNGVIAATKPATTHLIRRRLPASRSRR